MERETCLIAGIDWSRKEHQVNLFNSEGEVIIRFKIKHSAQGFRELSERLSSFGLAPKQILIGIETEYNQLVDYLHRCGYVIYVIPPSVVKGNRSRQGNTGVKDDVRDADLIADIVRTDRHRMKAWKPDGLLVQRIRSQLRLIDDITDDIVEGRNRLEAQLLRYFPLAIDLFSQLTAQIALKFLIAYPSPSATRRLDLEAFTAFCRDNGYRSTSLISKRFARLQRPSPHQEPEVEAIYSESVPTLAHRLLADVKLKTLKIRELQAVFQTHPDAEIFASIPGCGDLLAPKLLAVFGDDRDRFPSPDGIRALAGTCPATSQSGKSKAVFFRKGCNREWRDTFHQVAVSSVRQSLWANTYYEEVRLRGKEKGQSYRSLANRWVGIIWTLWQRRQLYDEAIHLSHVNRYKAVA